MRVILGSVMVLALAACGDGLEGWDFDATDALPDHDPDGESDGTGDGGDGGTDGEPDGVEDGGDEGGGDGSDDGGGPLGSWIGGPCGSAADCDYAEARCLAEAPGGMCSLECDRYCPDRDGHPTTFCVDAAALPDEAPGFGEGACFSRCDYGRFPGTGCRAGYGCVPMPRANEPGVEVHACVPGAEPPPVTPCREALAALGVSFEPATVAPEHPDTHPELTCRIEDPVYLSPPLFGVDLASFYSGASGRVLAACEMARALAATAEDLAAHGVVRILHMGTYNCRVIAGTATLSRHAYGDAIDFGGFELADGTRYTLIDHWEHDTTAPATPGGRFLYQAAHRWFDARIWNIILTPNYNLAHDDHFHVDLTPASHFIGWRYGVVPWGRYIGPAPYVD